MPTGAAPHATQRAGAALECIAKHGKIAFKQSIARLRAHIGGIGLVHARLLHDVLDRDVFAHLPGRFHLAAHRSAGRRSYIGVHGGAHRVDMAERDGQVARQLRVGLRRLEPAEFGLLLQQFRFVCCGAGLGARARIVAEHLEPGGGQRHAACCCLAH